MTARLLRLIAPRCSAAVANSRSVAEDMRTVCGPQFDVHPVWNAVDLNRFTPDGPRADLDALAGLQRSDGVIRVGLVATFARWKGHRTFIDALALLPRSLGIRGYVIGGPMYETTGSQVTLEELRQTAASLGLDDRVGFTGVVADSSAAMRALDIVVHASTDPEPFGLVIAEAMACAKPVITSGAGGAQELTEPGVNALHHTPGDARSSAPPPVRRPNSDSPDDDSSTSSPPSISDSRRRIDACPASDERQHVWRCRDIPRHAGAGSLGGA
jgi:glycosyltransferase involved in cell wall biosynthesis